MNRLPREPHDSSDLDALEDLKRSKGYELVEERIFDELERKQLELEGDLGIESTWLIRGYIKALRMVLTIPDIRASEIATEIKSQ